MYLLYLDDSGSTKNKSETHLVLGGMCIHEHQINYFTNQLDSLAVRLDPVNPDSVEFHASAIYSGREHPLQLTPEGVKTFLPLGGELAEQ